jgi:hypothetical protein
MPTSGKPPVSGYTWTRWTCKGSARRMSRSPTQTVDITVPLAVALVLLVAIFAVAPRDLRTVFRLVRWIVNCPEPPAPAMTSPPAQAYAPGSVALIGFST